MSGRDCDIAIIGGGLSGGLIALALTRARPDLSLRLIEAGPALGGNHRWSWFGTDLSAAGKALMAGFGTTGWHDGYEVRFPAYTRHLATSYHSLASIDFAARLTHELEPGTILTGREAAAFDAAGVTMRDGQRIGAAAVIDCRGFATSGDLTGGWQVFMGHHLRLPEPHGLHRPIIMDAQVAQEGGYRFVYVLPLGAHDVFIEDTYYQDTPLLDRSTLSARIDAYAQQHGWTGELVSFETGVLPVITGGDFDAWQSAHRVAGVALGGARGGFVHPLTSYTLPLAVDIALAVAAQADLPGERLAALLEAHGRAHWRRMASYRMLGTMLFGAARPDERYRIFERFYRLPKPLIERFYAGRSTWADRLRLLTGKPPVPITRAIRALATHPLPPLDPTRKDYE